jgi:hypothetical protein
MKNPKNKRGRKMTNNVPRNPTSSMLPAACALKVKPKCKKAEAIPIMPTIIWMKASAFTAGGASSWV